MLFTGLKGSTNAGAVYSRPVGSPSILNLEDPCAGGSFADLTWWHTGSIAFQGYDPFFVISSFY
jgi:hypothetical protein